jgi:hypothetical protein
MPVVSEGLSVHIGALVVNSQPPSVDGLGTPLGGEVTTHGPIAARKIALASTLGIQAPGRGCRAAIPSTLAAGESCV